MSNFRAFDAFDYHAHYKSSRCFVESDLGSISYGEAAIKVDSIINGFRALGICSCDRIAVIAKNRAEVLLLLLASLKGGPVVVPVNNRLAPAEMAWILEDSECKAVIAESEFIQALEGKIPSRIPPDVRFQLDGVVPEWINFDGWLVMQSSQVAEPSNQTDKPYLQVYTSGTTGQPKGVVLTEKNCLGQQLGLMATLETTLQPGDKVYQALPLFHVGGIFVTLWAVYRGATLIFRRDFSPAVTEDLMARGDVQHVALVPAMIKACLTVGANIPRKFDGLKSIIYGASPITAETLRLSAQRYRCGFIQIYGMTETHSVISVLTPKDHERALNGERECLIASAGRPIAGTKIKIESPEGEALPVGQIGEICVRAPQVMAGYWKRDEATKEAIKNDYLYTGDAGYVDQEGYLHIVDRLKDIIVSGGENVASKEVEEILLRHPQVADAAVIGIPDERWGEAVKAIIVCTESGLDEASLIEHCKQHLGGFKVPKSISLIDAIPRNGAGKVLKNKLRERYWSGEARRVS